MKKMKKRMKKPKDVLLITSMPGSKMIKCPHCGLKWFDSWVEVDGVNYCGDCYEKTFQEEVVVRKEKWMAKEEKMEYCPFCGKACPEYEYDPDPFWHNKTICGECTKKMPCAQAFEKALESGELARALDESDRRDDALEMLKSNTGNVPPEMQDAIDYLIKMIEDEMYGRCNNEDHDEK